MSEETPTEQPTATEEQPTETPAEEPKVSIRLLFTMKLL